MSTDRPTRVATDLLESAAVEGARQSRSAKQQLDHWARVGRAMSMRETIAQRRIEAVLAGTMTMDELPRHERDIVNAELDARVQAAAQRTTYRQLLANEGITTVSLDEEGRLVERRPDGSSSIIG